MMELDTDITKVQHAIDAYKGADSIILKQQKLEDLEKIICVVFATSDVRDLLHQFLTEYLIHDINEQLSSNSDNESNYIKSKFHVSIISLIRKLQLKNFVNRRLQPCDWYKLLDCCVVNGLSLVAVEENWSLGLQLLMSTEKSMRSTMSSYNDNQTSLIDRIGDLLVHPISSDRYTVLQQSEVVCRHLLNFLINAVNSLNRFEEEQMIEVKKEVEEERSEGPFEVVDGEKKHRRLSIIRFTFLVISALTSHESELGRWSLLQTLEQIEGRLLRYSGGLQLPNSIIFECNIVKVGKDLQSLLRNWPLPTLRLWRVIVRLLDKCVLTSQCFNALAPMIADSLHRLSNSMKVQLLTQDAWRDLVDIFTFYPGSRESLNRMCLLLRVYRRVYAHDVVQVRRLLGWWHFISRLSINMLHQLYETALTPFLSHVLGYFPVDATVSQEQAEKQFGYRLSSLNAASNIDCLYLASHVMAELWLQIDSPDEEGDEMRTRLLNAIREKKDECSKTEKEVKLDVATQQIYEEKLDSFPYKNLPVELFAKKPDIAERMLRYLQRWLELWHQQTISRQTDYSNGILTWILSRALRKWLLLVDQTTELPSSEKLIVDLVTLMVNTISNVSIKFHVDLPSKVDCVMAIIIRPNLRKCLTPRQANFRMFPLTEWPAFILFSSIVDFQHDISEEVSVSQAWSQAVHQLIILLNDSMLPSLDLFTVVADKLLRLTQRIAFEEPQVVLDLLQAWRYLTNKLTQYVQTTHQVATGDLALKPNLNAVETCLCFPFHLATRIKLELPRNSSPSELEIADTLKNLYNVMFDEAVLLGPLKSNSWCYLISQVIEHMAESKGSMEHFVMAAVTLCATMLSYVNVSLDSVGVKENIPSESITSPDEENCSLALIQRICKQKMTPSNKSESPGEKYVTERLSQTWHLPLGNLTSTLKALMTLADSLPDPSRACQLHDVPRLVSTLSNCLREVLLEKLLRPGSLLTLLEKWGEYIVRFVDWCERLPPRTLKPTIRQKVESLPTDLLDHVKAICPGPYDSKLLSYLSPLINCIVEASPRSVSLTPTQRKAKRAMINPLVSFWNSTFAECQKLYYPQDLMKNLKDAKVRYRLPIYLPPHSGDSNPVRVNEERLSSQRQDSQVNSEMFSTPPTSPTKVSIIGSFLHRSQLITSPSPKLAAKPTVLSRAIKSPSSDLTPAKQKSIDQEDNSQDFVFVPTASVRLNRIRLTEHQRERMREHRQSEYVPTMYNGLDNSQQSQLPYLQSGTSLSGDHTSQTSDGSQLTQKSVDQNVLDIQKSENIETSNQEKMKKSMELNSPETVKCTEDSVLGFVKSTEENQGSLDQSEKSTRENATKSDEFMEGIIGSEKSVEEDAVELAKSIDSTDASVISTGGKTTEFEKFTENVGGSEKSVEENGVELAKSIKDNIDVPVKSAEENPAKSEDITESMLDSEMLVDGSHIGLYLDGSKRPSSGKSIGECLVDSSTSMRENNQEVSQSPPPLMQRLKFKMTSDTENGESQKIIQDEEENTSNQVKGCPIFLGEKNILKTSCCFVVEDGGASGETHKLDIPLQMDCELERECSDETPNISLVAVMSSPIICSTDGRNETHDELPTGCSTPLSTGKKDRGPLRLGVSGLAAKLQPRLCLSLPEKRKKRTLSLIRDGTSRGAKMVALAQAHQAERREKARIEREANGSIASDSSFNSQSVSSPPGIIRSFFTPSKGHRVSFAEPLTSTWDGASPRNGSVSLCVEIGTPRDAELCRKSLVDEFESVNISWDNDIDDRDDLLVEKETELQDATIAMVDGEALDIEEFHADHEDTSGNPQGVGISQENEIEVILINDDSQTSDDDIEVKETQFDEDAGSSSPPLKRRRIQVTEEDEEEVIEVKGTQEIEGNESVPETDVDEIEVVATQDDKNKNIFDKHLSKLETSDVDVEAPTSAETKEIDISQLNEMNETFEVLEGELEVHQLNVGTVDEQENEIHDQSSTSADQEKKKDVPRFDGTITQDLDQQVRISSETAEIMQNVQCIHDFEINEDLDNERQEEEETQPIPIRLHKVDESQEETQKPALDEMLPHISDAEVENVDFFDEVKCALTKIKDNVTLLSKEDRVAIAIEMTDVLQLYIRQPT